MCYVFGNQNTLTIEINELHHKIVNDAKINRMGLTKIITYPRIKDFKDKQAGLNTMKKYVIVLVNLWKIFM